MTNLAEIGNIYVSYRNYVFNVNFTKDQCYECDKIQNSLKIHLRKLLKDVNRVLSPARKGVKTRFIFSPSVNCATGSFSIFERRRTHNQLLPLGFPLKQNSVIHYLTMKRKCSNQPLFFSNWLLTSMGKGMINGINSYS